MDNDPRSALGHLNRGISDFDDGDLENARRHFAQALLQEPDNELAWLWLGEASETPGQKRYCFDRAVSIEPDSPAVYRREALRAAGVQSEVPPVISDLAKPPLPPSLRETTKSGAQALRGKLPSRKSGSTSAAGARRTLLLCLGVVATALVILAAAWMLFGRESDSNRGVIYLAVAGPFSGESESTGDDIRNAALLAQDAVNNDRSGGPRVELIYFDDRNDPERAIDVAKQIVADDRIVGVIGHGASTTSVAAAPIYEAAHLPVISGLATSDELTAYPVFFRTIFSSHDESTILAHYVEHDLKQDRVSIVTGPSDYEQAFATAFTDEFGKLGTVAHVWTIGDDRTKSVAEIVSDMQQSDDLGALVLALDADDGYELVLQLRDAGLDPLIVGTEELGTLAFAHRFAGLPLERDTPGFYTQDIYAVSPLLYDSVGAQTLTFKENFRDRFGYTPGWVGPKIWDALVAFSTAAERSATSAAKDNAERRTQIARALHDMTSPETGFRGLSGPVFFTEEGDSPQGISIGMFNKGGLISAPVQYRLIETPGLYDMDAELASGTALDLDGSFVRSYRVIYTGIEMIDLSDLSSSTQSYTADFYIYFRYAGDDTPLNIIFTNASTSGLTLGTPIADVPTDSGMHYRLYRVQGVFTEPMDFSDYPWDQHELTIRFQNPDLTQNDIVYVADPKVIAMTQEERLRSGFDFSRSFDRMPNWRVTSLLYEQESIASTADDYDTDGLVYYSEFRVVMHAERDVDAFLSKNLLPLTLLTLVTYIAIWFPAEQASARIGFAITALLSSSVMLNSISSQLPAIGYNVAIEWGYYAYIGLSAMLVLLTIAVDRGFKAKRRARVKRIDTFIRIAYPLAILSVVALYWVVYREGNRTSGGQEDIRAGVSIIMGILLGLSAVVVLWPDHVDWRSLRGYNDPDMSASLETIAATKEP